MTGLRRVAFGLVLSLYGGMAAAQAAGDAEGLIGTWMLVGADRDASTAESERMRSPRGVLILDRAGYVFEFFSTASEAQDGSPAGDRSETLDRFGGFWGQFEVDEAAGHIRFAAAEGVSPDVNGVTFDRAYELDGDRLVVTSADEPHAQDDMRWYWLRMPVVEHLSPAYREVVGFWQHVEERQVNLDDGEVQRSSRRAPSVIVYTPSGFVGVHFPSLGREPVADDAAVAEGGRSGVGSYIGYFGTLSVYPGEVSHNILSGISPTTGSILRRYASIEDNVLTVELQSQGVRDPDDERRTVTEVELRRLSGAEDMLPR